MQKLLSYPLGIWGRLLFAFTAIASVTVFAVTTALFLLDSSSEIFSTITQKNLPELVNVAEIAELSGRVVAIAPSLASAPDADTKLRIREDLDDTLQQFAHNVGKFDNISPESELAIHTELEALQKNLASLQQVVAERLALENALVKHMNRLRWLYTDFLGELEPLNQDLHYNLDAEIDRIVTNTGQEEAQTAVIRLRENRIFQKRIDRIANDGDLLVSLLQQSSSVQRVAEVDNLANLTRDTLESLSYSLQQLSGEASILTLRQVLRDIFVQAEGPSSVFSIKKQILAHERESQQILMHNREIVKNLQTVVKSVVLNTYSEALESAAITRSELDTAKWYQVALVPLSVLIVAGVMWFYVRGNIVARLNRLSQSMGAIAEGELNFPVPEAGEDEIGQMAAALRVFRDTALEVEEANAQSIIDNASVGLVIADAGGTIRFVNPTAALLFGYESVDMVGDVLFSLVSAKEHNELEVACSAVFEGGEVPPFIHVYQGVRRDGLTFPVEIVIRPVTQRAERRLMITLFDVTEREEAQELLRERVRLKTEHLSRMNEALSEEIKERRRVQDELVQAGKLAALGQLSAGIAHELNQPLSAIRYYLHNARLLLLRGKIDLHQENITKIDELTARMAALINHLKNFSRLPSKNLHPVNAVGVLDSALSLYKGRILEENISITREPEEQPCMILAEDIRLEQVFINIIGNAIDAVSGQPQGQREITITFADKEETVAVSFFDSGTGIPSESMESIFDPFYTTKEVGKGLGLGLSISYNIVKDLLGEISVENVTGGGTVFTLEFQKADA